MRMLLMMWPFMTIDATHVLRVNVILSGPFTDGHVCIDGSGLELTLGFPAWRPLILAFVPGVL